VPPPSLCQRAQSAPFHSRLPAALTKVNNLATGDPKVALAYPCPNPSPIPALTLTLALAVPSPSPNPNPDPDPNPNPNQVAQAGLQAEPLLAKEASLSAAFDACSEDDKTKKETLKKYTLMRDELSYQAGKLYDARWADPDDTADLQTSIKKAKAAIENFLASVPAEKRAPPAAT